MATVNEGSRVHRWLKTVLSANSVIASTATGGVWDTDIPAGKAYPAVVFQFMAPLDDTPGNAGFRVWARGRYQVKAVGEGNSYSAVQSLADGIEAALEATIGGVADVVIDYSRRVQIVQYKEKPVGNERGYVHLGGLFEIAAHYAG